jgi:uncharacterized protein YgbK (DUF1537 family)
LQVTPAAILAGEIGPEDAVHFALEAGSMVPPIIYSSTEPAEVEAAQRALGREEAGELIERFLASVARQLLARGITRFVIAGGETSGAVVQALGARSLAIGPEIDPGVPWTSFTHEKQVIALALKSGNFGGDDFLVRAWTMLE